MGFNLIETLDIKRWATICLAVGCDALPKNTHGIGLAALRQQVGKSASHIDLLHLISEKTQKNIKVTKAYLLCIWYEKESLTSNFEDCEKYIHHHPSILPKCYEEFGTPKNNN